MCQFDTGLLIVPHTLTIVLIYCCTFSYVSKRLCCHSYVTNDHICYFIFCVPESLRQRWLKMVMNRRWWWHTFLKILMLTQKLINNGIKCHNISSLFFDYYNDTWNKQIIKNGVFSRVLYKICWLKSDRNDQIWCFIFFHVPLRLCFLKCARNNQFWRHTEPEQSAGLKKWTKNVTFTALNYTFI